MEMYMKKKSEVCDYMVESPHNFVVGWNAGMHERERQDQDYKLC